MISWKVQYFLLGLKLAKFPGLAVGFLLHLGNIQPYFFKYLFCSIISLLLCWDSHSNMSDFLILFDKSLKPCYFFPLKKKNLSEFGNLYLPVFNLMDTFLLKILILISNILFFCS